MVTEDIYTLWDRLADYPAAQSDRALENLLGSLAGLLGAEDAYWVGAVRVDDPVEGDPYQGWRALRAFSLKNEPHTREIRETLQRAMERGEVVDPITVHIRQAGEFRVRTLSELMPPAFFESEHYHFAYGARGITDTLFVVVPLNGDAEAYFGFHRTSGVAFSAADRELAGTALRGLRWFHRQLFLSHGLRIGDSPLAPAHRRVLHELLTEDSEAAIAERLGLSPATVHTYVQKIYRCLGVRSRAGLAALWLGGG